MNFIDKMVEHFIKLNRKLRRWQRVVSILGAVVVFVTTYALVLPAITLDKETASTQAGMEIAASENEPSEDGTVFESQPEEDAVEEEAEADDEEASGTESGSQEAENTEEENSEEVTSEDASTTEETNSEEEITSEVISAPEGETTSEIAPAPEEDAEADKDEETNAAAVGVTENAAAAATSEVAPQIELITEQTQLVYEAEDYKVFADFGEEAKLPVGVKLEVKEITAESDPEIYQEYYDKTLSQMQDKYDENTTLSFAKFYDISFVYEGTEVEPAGDVKVRIEYKEAVDIAKDTAVDTVHFDKNDEEKVDVIDTEIDAESKVEKKVETDSVKAIEFKSDQFSVYGVVGTVSAEPGVYTFRGEGYVVRVKIPEEAQLPLGTKLVVSEIEKDSDEYVQLLGKTWLQVNREYFEVEEMRKNYNEGMGYLPDVGLMYIDDARFFNISFILDEKEVTPNSNVFVDIELDQGLSSELETKAGGSTYSEDGVEILENVETDSKDGGVVSFKYELNEAGNVGAYITRDTHDKVVEPVYAPAPELKAYNPPLRAGETTPALNPPTAEKKLEENNNGDGTYKLSLSVTGAAASSEVTDVQKTNVVIVMDRSSSMVDNYAQLDNVTQSYDTTPREGVTYYGREQHNSNYRYFPIFYQNGQWWCQHYSYTEEYEEDDFIVYNGNRYTGNIESRLTAEQTALSSLVASLLDMNKTGTLEDGTRLDDIMEISIISFGDQRFSGKATEVNWSTNYETLMSGVGKTTTTSGTNWEDALMYAKEKADAYQSLEYQKDDNMFIIFLTDGEPTAYYPETGGAHHYNDVGGGFIAAYEPARDDALALVAQDYTLFGIFTYGSGAEQLSYLKRLINYSYSNGTNDTAADTQALRDYFFDAADTSALLNAFEVIISHITDSVAYGRVQINDGMTTDAATTTVVSGAADGFRYSVSGNVGELYSVTATGDPNNPEVEFTIGTTTYSGSDVQRKVGTDNKIYYSVTLGEGSSAVEYKMALATIDDDGQVTWDLGAIGTLLDGYTYKVEFVVWPNQDAYDYVAALNNGISPIIDSQGHEVVVEWDDSKAVPVEGKDYKKGGVEAYPSIVKYSNGTYSVLTNTDQTVNYSIVTETTTEVDGETQTVTTYDGPYTIPLETPDPMDLEGTTFDFTKYWKDALDPSHLEDLIKKAEEAGTTYSVTLNVNKDGELYKAFNFTPVKNEQTGQYEWPSQQISIAPAILVSHHPGGSATYTTVKYDDGTGLKTYYVLNTGHQYEIEETDTDFHFEFEADPYHPALVDNVMTNMSFVVDDDDHIVEGSTATKVGDVPLEEFRATNSLTSELDITKVIDDENDVLTDDQENAETFTYKVTLTVPYDPEEPDKQTKYMNAYEFVPRYDGDPSASNRYLIHGYQSNESDEIRGLDDDVSRFTGKVHGRYTVSYPGGAATLDEIFSPDAGGTTQSGVIYITLKQNEVLRITNIPKGSTYQIQEIYANLRSSDPSRDADSTPDANPEASNIEAQGYEVSVATKHGSPTVSTTATANDTVSGTITDSDTRYYNQFTNTLTDAVAMKLAVRKHLQGYEWSGERYYVRLTDASTISRFTDTDRYLTSASGSDDVTYTYASPLRFSEPGEYTFTFTEYDSTYTNVLSGTVAADGVQYGDVVTVKVTVEKQDGKLAITKVEGGTLEDTDDDGTNDTIVGTITNKVIPISLYKIGDANTDNFLTGVKFKLYNNSDCAEEHLVTEDAKGNPIGTNGEIEIGPDGTKEIGVLAAGTYYLKETQGKTGYVQLTELITITVAEDGTISYAQESYSPSKMYNSKSDKSNLVKEKGGLFITATDDEGNATGYTLTVNNNSGMELPHTGGPGTFIYTLSGLALIMATALMYGFRMRRRERRLN